VDTGHPGIRVGTRRSYRAPKSFREPDYDRPRPFPRTLVSIDLTSARCLAAYVYAGGAGESTTDLAWDGQTSIFKNGTLLAEGERFRQDGQITVTDVDLYLLRQGRGHEHVSRQPLKSKETSSFPPYSVFGQSSLTRT
jgi:hypothetical protein